MCNNHCNSFQKWKLSKLINIHKVHSSGSKKGGRVTILLEGEGFHSRSITLHSSEEQRDILWDDSNKQLPLSFMEHVFKQFLEPTALLLPRDMLATILKTVFLCLMESQRIWIIIKDPSLFPALSLRRSFSIFFESSNFHIFLTKQSTAKLLSNNKSRWRALERKVRYLFVSVSRSQCVCIL